MLLLELVICLYSFTYLVYMNILMPKLRQNETFLRDCVSEIQKEYFKSDDFVIYMNTEEKYNDLILNLKPIVIQNRNEKEIISFYYVKADAYIITISDTRIHTTIEFLTRTSQWNSRAKFIIIFDGNLFNLFEILNKYYIFNIVVLVLKSEEEIEVFSYFPYDFSIPESNRNYPVLLNICFKDKLQKDVILFPNKLPEKWDNITVGIILMELPPYVIYRSCNDRSQTGIEMRVLRLVSIFVFVLLGNLSRYIKYLSRISLHNL